MKIAPWFSATIQLAVLLSIVAGRSVSAADAPPSARPNIVFIITDDQRWDYLGCTGHPVLKTPNIDRIAKEGAKFTNFFVCTPLCSPSRASYLTGLYPHTHHVINNDKLGLDGLIPSFINKVTLR